MDFTIIIYKKLLKTLADHGYSFLTFEEFLQYDKAKLPDKFVILRHDVDMLPYHSLRFAKIQFRMGIKGAYYFRAKKVSWNSKVIKEISSMAHEIGYHYENLSTCKGDPEKAISDFKIHLESLRKLAPVATICMHGSPRSRFDSKDMWKSYDYRDYGIIGEPYFDIDFDKMFYLTDTGRRWDGMNFSIRDKVSQQKEWAKQNKVYKSTRMIIKSICNGSFPMHVMFTFHPQRWSSSGLMWIYEFFTQKFKNAVKFAIIKLMRK